MSDVTWLSYTELAERLGIRRQSARQLAIRKRWMRKPGNDGQARVGVPLESLTRPDTCKPTRPATCPETGNATRNEDPATPPATPADDTPRLQAQIARLEERIDGLRRLLDEANRQRDELRSERDCWAVQAEQVVATVDPLKSTIEALKTALDAERGRLSELREERDRWRDAATARRSWWPWRKSA